MRSQLNPGTKARRSASAPHLPEWKRVRAWKPGRKNAMHRREFVKRSRSSPLGGEKKNRWEKPRCTALPIFFPSLPPTFFLSHSENYRPVVLASCNVQRERGFVEAEEIQVEREFFSPPTSRNSFLRLVAEIIREIPSLSLSLPPPLPPCVTTRLCGAACNNVYLIFLPVLSTGVIGDEF